MSALDGRVLVIGSDTLSFLSVVRSLGRAGLEVHVAGCPENAPARRSRYIAASHPIKRHDVDGLLDLASRQRFDLVIPCDDFSIVPMQANRERLAGVGRFALLDPEAFAVCADKARTYELAEQLKIPLAPQRIATREEDLDAIIDAFGWPLVLKPPQSVSESRPGVRQTVRKVRSRAGLGLLEFPLLVQRHFIGTGVGVEVLCRQGDVLVAFQHERLHEPVTGGGSSYRRSVPLSPPLLAAVRRLMRALNYTGVGMVEFKVNQSTGEWILIEINGRFWGSLPLSVAAGADFPRYLYEMLTAGRLAFPQTYRHGVRARNWRVDVSWIARNCLSDRRDPMLMTRPLGQVALELLHVPRESSDTLTVDDPAPAWAEVTAAARDLLRPLDPWRRRRAARALARAGRILFVCNGNVCRSPFAELDLRGTATVPIEVDSAGYRPVAGRSCPDGAVRAARELGVDLAPHRSRILTPDQVRWADVIFVFDRDNDAEVRGWFPAAAAKVHYLGSLAGSMRVADPWGATDHVFRDTYRRIHRGVAAIARQLESCPPDAVAPSASGT